MSRPLTPSSSRAQASQASATADVFNFERSPQDGQRSSSTTATQKSILSSDRPSSHHPSNTYLDSLATTRAPNEADTSQSEAVQEGPSLSVGDRAYGNQRLRRSRNNSSIGLSPAHQKTPSRSFFHRSFHGPHGKLPSSPSMMNLS